MKLEIKIIDNPARFTKDVYIFSRRGEEIYLAKPIKLEIGLEDKIDEAMIQEPTFVLPGDVEINEKSSYEKALEEFKRELITHKDKHISDLMSLLRSGSEDEE